MPLASCDTETHIMYKYDCSYLEAEMASTIRLMSRGNTCRQNCKDFCFMVLIIGLALTTAQAQYITITLALILMVMRCDADENYIFFIDSQLV